MKQLLFAVALVTTLACFASAGSLPPLHLGNQPHVVSGHQAQPQAVFFCPPATCLYYAGDPNPNNGNDNALFDFENPGIGITDAEVWVGVKPTANVTITGTSGNYVTTAAAIGINPTPFVVQTGIAAGRAGRLICNTTGNTVLRAYGANPWGLNSMNYWAKKLARSCRLNRAGKASYIVFIPQYNDNFTIGYLNDVEDNPGNNHVGWRNDVDDDYFNSTSFGVAYEPTWGGGGACGGVGCDAFSISLSGRR